MVAASLAWPRDSAARQRLRAAARRVTSWPHVARLAERHRVAALAAHALEDASIEIPEPIRLGFARRRMEVAFEELLMAAELSRLQLAFAAAECSFTVLKGVAAALQGFGQIGLRQNRDIDILIKVDDLLPAAGILIQLGYTQIEPQEGLTASALRTWAQAHKDLVFRKGTDGVIVEVHWRLFDNRRFAADLADQPTVQLLLPSGVAVTALTPEAAFAYMAAHGAQHAWSRLKWLADFAAYATRFGETRTAEIYDELKRRGLGGPVGQGLVLSHEMIGLALPEALARDLCHSRRLQLLRGFAREAIGGARALELEDRAFGSTLKTLSHYLLSGGAGYLLAQAVLDVGEVPNSQGAPWLRRLGPVAKIPMWLGALLIRLFRRRLADRV